jgi:hypothetical protein
MDVKQRVRSKSLDIIAIQPTPKYFLGFRLFYLTRAAGNIVVLAFGCYLCTILSQLFCTIGATLESSECHMTGRSTSGWNEC